MCHIISVVYASYQSAMEAAAVGDETPTGDDGDLGGKLNTLMVMMVISVVS